MVARRPTVRRGDLWWYEHPESGRRPFLILTRNEAVDVLNQVLAIPVTRTVRGIPTEVPLDESDGLPVPCVLNVDNTSPIRPSLCTDRVAQLGPDRMAEVCAALARATACG